MWSMELTEVPFEADIRELLMAYYPVLRENAGEKSGPVSGGEHAGMTARPVPDGETGAQLRFRGHREGECYVLEIDYPDGEYTRFTSRILDDRFATKCEIKRRVYTALSEHEGYALPWGTLTGIRPTKLVLAELEKRIAAQKSQKSQAAQSTEKMPQSTQAAEDLPQPESAEAEASGAAGGIREMKNRFQREFLIGDEKTELCFRTAQREAEVLQRFDYAGGWSLYAGIPFCPSKCLYCSFTSYPIGLWKERKDAYLRTLEYEIREVSARMAETGKPLQTVYIGGGTPTSLEAEELAGLIAAIRESNDTSQLMEFTVEAGRPDSITAEKLQALREGGVTRISVNPQTMNQKTLDLIGRKHTVEEVEEKFRLARRLGFDNINMDIIIGLPGENPADVERTMDALEALKPDDITVHSLALKRAARLSEERGLYTTAGPEEITAMAELTGSRCEAMGLQPYYLYRQKNMAGNFENVGYCRNGHEGIYNILIMEEKQPIVGCGAGTTTKLPLRGGADGVLRIENVKDPQVYIERIDEMLARKRDSKLWQ